MLAVLLCLVTPPGLAGEEGTAELLGDSVAADGADLIGGAFPILGAAGGGGSDASIAFDPVNDRYLVVWSERRRPDCGSDIFGQLLGPDGSRIGGVFRISRSRKYEGSPAVAFNTTSEQYLVVWQRTHHGVENTRDFSIYGQRVKANGLLAGGNLRISYGNYWEWHPSVTYNSTTNQYLVVWSEERPEWSEGEACPHGPFYIYGQRIRANGELAGGEIQISGGNAKPGLETGEVTYNSVNSQYLVVWEDYRRSTGYPDVYGQRLRANGTKVGWNSLISGASTHASREDPTVTHNPISNQYLVVWTTRGPAEVSGIRGQRLKANGRLAGDNTRISGAIPGGNARYPAVAHSPASNQYLVVFPQDIVEDSGVVIHARRIKATGRPAGRSFEVSDPDSGASRQIPGLAHDSTHNRFLVVWRSGDLLGQLIAGSPG